jgi:hypothetical protein
MHGALGEGTLCAREGVGPYELGASLGRSSAKRFRQVGVLMPAATVGLRP